MKRDLLILFFLLFNLNFIFADCGNGILESGEQCDDGNYISRDGCSYSCYNETYRSSYCGDGRLFVGVEECDDKNKISGDRCSSTCKNETYDVSMCGDSVLFFGYEECDLGVNGIIIDGCNDDCTFATYNPSYCGDNVVFIGKENCDDRNTISGDRCSSICKNETYYVNMCGDSVIFRGEEECDRGINGISGDGCYDDCTNVTYNSSYCGDGVLFPINESCDDGNRISRDGCSNICKKESYSNSFCGDNILFVGFEDCDDGNKISGDECSSTCDFEYCGDGILTLSFDEECDDANPIPGDGCSNCTIETYNASMCGDGIIFSGYEECDDHNLDSGDGCSNTCTLETAYDPSMCGDGSLFPGFEQCDDGNKISNDGCSNSCLFETCANGVNLNVYSVTDISGSMTIQECADTNPFYCCWFNDCNIANTCINTCHGTYYKRMDLAQRANKAFIENLFKISGNKVGLVTYATVSNDTGYHELSNNSISLNNTIDSWASYGRTCICCGVLNAIDKMVNETDSSAYKVLVVMSDGEANVQCLDKYPSLSWENAAVQASCDAYEDYGIVVHTVGFGADAGEKTLQKMADSAFDDNIRTGAGGISGVFNNVGFGNILGEWTIIEEDYSKTNDYEGFYFTINGYKSNNLTILTRDLTEECKDYVDEFSCNNCDNSGCMAAENSVNKKVFEAYPEVWNNTRCGDKILGPDSCNYTMQCKCLWDDILNACSYTWELIPDLDCGSTPTIGFCSYSENTNDNCDDGFLEYSWTTIWSWGADNGYADFNNGPSNDINDYILENGIYYYDPLKLSRNCISGSNALSCPAKIQLPFFGFYNLIIAVLLIAGVYFVFRKELE